MNGVFNGFVGRRDAAAPSRPISAGVTHTNQRYSLGNLIRGFFFLSIYLFISWKRLFLNRRRPATPGDAGANAA